MSLISKSNCRLIVSNYFDELINLLDIYMETDYKGHDENTSNITIRIRLN